MGKSELDMESWIYRGVLELSGLAYKMYFILWEWEIESVEGDLSSFTAWDMAEWCGTYPGKVVLGMRELESKGWIERVEYDRENKKWGYRYVPIRKVRIPGVGLEL